MKNRPVSANWLFLAVTAAKYLLNPELGKTVLPSVLVGVVQPIVGQIGKK